MMGLIEVVYWLIAPSKIANILIIILVFWLMTFFVCTIVFGMMFLKRMRNDIVIIFDKNLRWDIHYKFLHNVEAFKAGSGIYPLDDETNYLGSNGKILTMRYWNKLEGLKITANKSEWMFADSLSNLLDNDDARKIANPPDKLKDIMLIIVAICVFMLLIGMLLIGLKVFGVIKDQVKA